MAAATWMTWPTPPCCFSTLTRMPPVGASRSGSPYTPSMQPVTHQEAEARGLALHTEVARRLRSDPELVAQARRRIEEWVESGALARPWAQAWADVLAKPVDEIIAVLTDAGEWACSLRQSSAFAGALDPRTRWAILRRVPGRSS